MAKIECGEPVMPTTLLAIEDGLDWPTGRCWDHLTRHGTQPLEKEEGLPPDLAAALRAEPRLDAEGQRLIAASTRPGAVGGAVHEPGHQLERGMPPTRSPLSWWMPGGASRRAFSSPKHRRSHDDRLTDIRTAR